MSTDVREFIDFWVENSVHATEQSGATGAEQHVPELVRRLVEMAESEGLTQNQLESQVGDLPAYLREKLERANEVEKDRRQAP